MTLASLACTAACSGGGGAGGSDGTAGTTTPSGPDATDPSQNPAAYTAFPDPSQPAVVAVGRRFGLLVEVDPSAGRRWQVEGPLDTAVVLPLGVELVPDNTALPGNPDTQVLTFVGQGVGTATVRLVEVGPDGSPVPDAAPVTFTIFVTADGLPPTTTLPPQTTTTEG